MAFVAPLIGAPCRLQEALYFFAPDLGRRKAAHTRSSGDTVHASVKSKLLPRAYAAARAPSVSVRIGRGTVTVRAAIGVRTVDAVVDIIVGIGPKVVIGIRPVNVIEQVVIGVGPEQRSEPAEGHAATPPGPD